MSALSLQYPKKPIRLADDLESFVYVIVYMILRHFRHRSSPKAKLDMDEETLAVINGKNNDLATKVHFLFCASYPCEDGYRGGGEYKLDKILLNKVPVEFGKGAQTKPLAILLKRLWNVLHMHYHATDFEHLKQYQVARRELPSSEMETSGDAASSCASQETVEAPNESTDSDDDYDGVQFPDDDADMDSNIVNLSDRQWTVQTPLPTTPNPDLLALNNHVTMVRAFRAVFRKRDGQVKDSLSKTVNDKYVDQFIGLQAMLGKPPQKPSTNLKRLWSEVEPESPQPGITKNVRARMDFDQDISFGRNRKGKAKQRLPVIAEDEAGEAGPST